MKIDLDKFMYFRLGADRRKQRKKFLVLFAAFFFFSIDVSASERLLMSHAGMEAYLNHLDCSSKYEAKLDIRSPNSQVFDGERIELQRLIAQVRAVLSIGCPAIKRLTTKGTVKNQLYFAGATEKEWGWKIIGLYAAPVSSR